MSSRGVVRSILFWERLTARGGHLALIAKYKLLFIIVNLSVLVWTPIFGRNFPLRVELLDGAFCLVVMNAVLVIFLSIKERKLGKTS